MSYIGDFRLGDTFDTKFTTRQISGAPFTLGGTPVISAYVGNNATEITAGITLSVDFDSVTGLNNVRVVATSGNGYATASNYQLVITTGSVNSVSVVGEVIAQFSIENRSALMPTTATRTLDVSAGGEAGLDWANVGTQGSTVNLSATTTNVVNTATAVTTVNGLAANVITAASINADAITAAKIADAAIDAATFAAGAINAAAIAADAITAAKIADGAIDAATFAAGAINAAAIAADAITDAKVAADVTIASVTGAVGSVTGAVGSVTGAVGSVTAAVTVGTNNDKTAYSLTAGYDLAKTAAQAGDAMALTAAYNASKTAAQAGDAMALTGGERTSLAGVINTTAIVESYRANGATPTPAQFMAEVLAHLGESSISGTTKTTHKLDHVTTAQTFTLDDGTTPTSITRAS